MKIHKRRVLVIEVDVTELADKDPTLLPIYNLSYEMMVQTEGCKVGEVRERIDEVICDGNYCLDRKHDH